MSQNESAGKSKLGTWSYVNLVNTTAKLWFHSSRSQFYTVQFQQSCTFDNRPVKKILCSAYSDNATSKENIEIDEEIDF